MKEPRILIKKKERKLMLYDGRKLLKTYKVSLGASPVGDKRQEGDGKTPEGDFYIFTKNEKSAFYLSLGISYPGIDDAKRGLKEGLISIEEHDAIIRAIEAKEMPLQKTRLGGEIYIHGGGCDSDWTQGCIALENDKMKEIFDLIPVGTRVSIRR